MCKSYTTCTHMQPLSAISRPAPWVVLPQPVILQCLAQHVGGLIRAGALHQARRYITPLRALPDFKVGHQRLGVGDRFACQRFAGFTRCTSCCASQLLTR